MNIAYRHVSAEHESRPVLMFESDGAAQDLGFYVVEGLNGGDKIWHRKHGDGRVLTIDPYHETGKLYQIRFASEEVLKHACTSVHTMSCVCAHTLIIRCIGSIAMR